jgi:hypothetical protein
MMSEHARHPEVSFSWSGPRLTAVITVAAMLVTWWGTQALQVSRQDIRISALEAQLMEIKRVQDENTAGRIRLTTLVEDNAKTLQELKESDRKLEQLIRDHDRRLTRGTAP